MKTYFHGSKMGLVWFKKRGLERGGHYAIQCYYILGKLVLYWNIRILAMKYFSCEEGVYF
jgi:hypothetical protein